MILNKQIAVILSHHNIDVNEGTLCLLAYYFQLDPDTTISEETIKAINVTKIIDKDYTIVGSELKWLVPLFEGQEVQWEWVKEWIDGFGKINMDRKGSHIDATKRMKDFFAEFPLYRMEDIFAARDLYFKSVRDPQYLMKSHKFIRDGVGVMKKSELLGWCEKVAASKGVTNNNDIKGKLL